MAEYIVDEFKVKRSGLFAAWRGIRIYVSDGGVVRTEDTTSETINLDRISDYKANDRRYGPGNTITIFCNLDTFTRYTVKAIDERPFVVVTDELNEPACGYQTPIPEPHVPFNPFGNPTYNPYRTFNYCNYEGLSSEIVIEKKDYQGDNMPIAVGDQFPIKYNYQEVDNKFEPIRPFEMELNFIENSNFELEEFYTEDERTFRVTSYEGGVIKGRGYIIPDSCTEGFVEGNNVVSIKCTDAIQSLKTVTFPVDRGSTFDLQQSFIGILCYCLSPTNLNLNINTICNFYATGMPTGLGDDPLDLATINPLRLADDKGTTMTCFAVLEAVCSAFGMYLVQQNGEWNFVRFNEMAQEVVRQRSYNYKGFRISQQQVANKRIIGGYLK